MATKTEDAEVKLSEKMQVRFDGSFGFAGGLVDESEVDGYENRATLTEKHVVDALNRELREEMNLNTSKYRVTLGDHIFTDVDDVHRLFLHFFALNVQSEDAMRNIERDALNVNDDVDEVFGICRVPLFTMQDGFRGFPVFLNNSFVGNSRDQLLGALKMLGIMSDDEISAALQTNYKFNEIQQKRNCASVAPI